MPRVTCTCDNTLSQVAFFLGPVVFPGLLVKVLCVAADPWQQLLSLSSEEGDTTYPFPCGNINDCKTGTLANTSLPPSSQVLSFSLGQKLRI